MPFEGFDPVEEEVGVRVTLMSAEQLIAYVKLYMRAMHDIELRVEGMKERSVFTKLKKTYGNEAGLIVKWVLWQYDGVIAGRPIGFMDFASGRKWWTDQMYSEMQLHKRELEKKSTPYEKKTPIHTFSKLKDL